MYDKAITYVLKILNVLPDEIQDELPDEIQDELGTRQ